MFKIESSFQNKIGIYKIINTKNGKSYIGSSKNIYDRLHRHKHELVKQKHFNSYLQNAFNKDISFFTAEIIEECKKDKLFIREQYWIDRLVPEYNICKYVIDVIISDEAKMKISKTLKEKYKLGTLKPTNTTKIKCFDLDCNLVGVYDSLKEASETLKVRYHSIQKNLKKEFMQTHGYQFFYINELDPNIQIKTNSKNISSKAIYTRMFVYDLKTKEGFSTNINHFAKKVGTKVANLKANMRKSRIPFKQRYILTPLARIKFGELLETPEEDNQQPSLGSDSFEGSTTSSESQVDNNSTTSAGQTKWLDYESWKQMKKWIDNHPYSLKI